MARLQDDELEKQEARALAMRRRFEERTDRFLNPKQRTIGIDKEFLDHQVEERKQLIMLGKENGIQEAMHQEQILKYLEEQELKKSLEALQVRQEVNETLSRQALQAKNNALREGGPLNLDICGPSSVQCFAGEDHTYKDRRKAQQEQLQYWCSQGMKITYDKFEKEKREKDDYSKYIIEEDQMRCNIAEDEERHRRDVMRSVMLENKQLADARQKKKQEIYEQEKQNDYEETKAVTTSPFYCEDTNYAKSAISDHRFRPDHFKGFSPETLKSIIANNDSVVEEKNTLQEEERIREDFWAEKESQMILQMEEAERHKKLLQVEENKVQSETLTKQREELKQKQLQMKEDRFGSIGQGFFQKFGTSCR